MRNFLLIFLAAISIGCACAKPIAPDHDGSIQVSNDNTMNNKPRVGVAVLIINSDNQLLLGKRKKSIGVDNWGTPGGHLELGESLEECAIREVFEETGLQITNPKFLAITNDYFAINSKHYISIFMVAAFPSNQVVKNCEPDKTEAWHWFNVNNLPQGLFLPLQHLIGQKGYGNAFSAIQSLTSPDHCLVNTIEN